MIGFIIGALGGLALVVIAATVARAWRSHRLHQRRINKAFMAGYRAAFRQVRRSDPTDPAPPGVSLTRSRSPVDAGNDPDASASTGSTRQGKHTP
jgi:hypothetical protein